MGKAMSCAPRCCRCFSAPLDFLQMKRPNHQKSDDDLSEVTDLLEEENYRSALSYSEEHIQVLLDHQMSTLADRLAALDSQLEIETMSPSSNHTMLDDSINDI
mmetsp:Transcript_23025/g.34300  ORF Transcript_23025/g.34300 Transcript_23025/m.34300 type:complete len:103 (+) Transcript_23025:107-415(+)